MKRLFVRILLGSLSLSAFSNDIVDSTLGGIDAIGDVVFKPIKSSTYTDDEMLAIQSNLVKQPIQFLGSLIHFANMGDHQRLNGGSFHQSKLVAKSVISRSEAAVISNADIDKILAEVGSSLRGQEYVTIVFENPEHSSQIRTRIQDVSIETGDQTLRVQQPVNELDVRKQINDIKLTNANADTLIDDINRGAPRNPQYIYTDKLVAHDVSKRQLERALQAMGNNNIKAYSVRVGRVKTNVGRVAGSAVAVYLTLDFFHTLGFDDNF